MLYSHNVVTSARKLFPLVETRVQSLDSKRSGILLDSRIFALYIEVLNFLHTALFSVECSHQRSHELYTESILHNRFVCVPCKSYNSFASGLCSNNVKTVMGNDEPQTNSGNYYLNTNGKAPFALGDEFPAQRS